MDLRFFCPATQRDQQIQLPLAQRARDLVYHIRCPFNGVCTPLSISPFQLSPSPLTLPFPFPVPLVILSLNVLSAPLSGAVPNPLPLPLKLSYVNTLFRSSPPGVPLPPNAPIASSFPSLSSCLLSSFQLGMFRFGFDVPSKGEDSLIDCLAGARRRLLVFMLALEEEGPALEE